MNETAIVDAQINYCTGLGGVRETPWTRAARRSSSIETEVRNDGQSLR